MPRDSALASSLHRVRAVPRLGILVGVVLTHLVADTGCYNPELRDCTVQCSAPTDCTAGQVCQSGWCAMPDGADCSMAGDNLAIDGAVTAIDAPSDPSVCEQGCTNGTCVDGVCVIDCSAPYACDPDVRCPDNLPCRVICGYRACRHKVYCEQSTSCEVQCVGDYSCDDEIHCNANRCDVDCIGVGSCSHKVKCSGSCACDVSCTGASSCGDVNECPAATCRLGAGCSSLLAGCDSC